MKYGFIIILLCNFLSAFSQQKLHEKLPLLQEEVEKLNGRIISLLQKKQIIEANEEVDFFHVYCFYIDIFPEDVISKEDLLSLNFENNLKTSCFQFGKSNKKKNNYIRTLESFVYTTANKQLIASGDASLMTVHRSNFPDKVELEEVLLEISQNYDDAIFFTIGSFHPIYCLTKENNLFVIFENKSRDWEVIPVEEFVEKYYDKLALFGLFL